MSPDIVVKGFGPRHYAYIDAIRGWAFFAVLVFHAALCVGHFGGISLLQQGGYGVQLFFIASSVTLCNSMASRRTQDRFPVTFFYLRRLFRIAPLYWCALAFYLAWPGALPFGTPQSRYPVLTALFIQGWHPNPLLYNGVPGGWSIAVEMTFYAIFPLLFVLLNSIKRSTVALFAAIIYMSLLETSGVVERLFPGVPTVVAEFFKVHWFPHQLPVFVVGIFTYHVLKDESVKAWTASRFFSNSLLLFCSMMLLSFFYGHSFFIPTYFIVVLALAGTVVALSSNPVWFVNPAPDARVQCRKPRAEHTGIREAGGSGVTDYGGPRDDHATFDRESRDRSRATGDSFDG